MSYYGQMITPPENRPMVGNHYQTVNPNSYNLPPPPPPPPPHHYMMNQQPQQMLPPPPPQQQPPIPRSQLFDNGYNNNGGPAYSQNGTTFYFPSIPLDQMSSNQQQPPPPQMVAPPPPPPPHLIHTLPPPPPLPQNGGGYGFYASQQQPQQQIPPPPNTTKVTGGVAATLDYSIEEMGKFLSTMSCGIMLPSDNTLSNANFQTYNNFITQLLTATRLPSATVILSLVYLSKRWVLGNLPSVSSDNNVMYRMLVVSLLLANKFHDDNTFTNKSWYEATGISVSELTRIESDWLKEVKWDLHLNEQEIKGWDKWNDCWLVFSKQQQQPQQLSTPVQSPESPSEPISPIIESKPGYTIPKWFEMANNGSGPANGNNSGVLDAKKNEFSFFQQSFANNNEKEQQQHSHHRPHESYYVSAYNDMATCNCSMCSFEPVTNTRFRRYYPHHQQPLPPPPPPQQQYMWQNPTLPSVYSMNFYPSVAAC